MPAIRIGRFQVLGTLGTGAHSQILQVRRSADARNYALKVVPIRGPEDAKYLQQARHEYRVAQQLDHPNLIKIYALEIQRDWLFRARRVHLLIEYVNGRTMDMVKGLTVPQLVLAFSKIASGLAHMHRRKVYHADLKPNNILLSRSGEIKIIDYGLAWLKGQAKNRLQGTPEYMAPEQAKDATVNARTDIYNFGATMYRLTTWRLPPPAVVANGALPLDSRSWRQLVTPVEECNRDAPHELCELIHRCLEYRPQNRPERMHDVAEVLEQLAAKLVRSPEDHLEYIEW